MKQLAQTTGTSEEVAMSQKAATDAINALKPEAFTALTIAATTTWATAGRMLNNKTLTLTQNTVLDFTGLANGAEGTLELIQDAVGGRTFIPPAGSKPETVFINPSPNGITVLGWKWTGTYIYWTSKGFY